MFSKLRPYLAYTITALVVSSLLLAAFCIKKVGDNPLKKKDRPDSSSAIQQSAWKNIGEDAIVSRLGKPKKTVSGWAQIGPDKIRILPTSNPKTFIYENDKGTLYIWLDKDGDGFICVDSLYFDKGVQL
jgi:hypothetical protein